MGCKDIEIRKSLWQRLHSFNSFINLLPDKTGAGLHRLLQGYVVEHTVEPWLVVVHILYADSHGRARTATRVSVVCSDNDNYRFRVYLTIDLKYKKIDKLKKTFICDYVHFQFKEWWHNMIPLFLKWRFFGKKNKCSSFS